MKLYDCQVNLGGPVLHLVPKEKITAAEMKLLLHIHGDDTLRGIVEHGSVKTPHLKIYDDLVERYNETIVQAVFGRRSRKLDLPTEIDMDDFSGSGADDAEDADAEDDASEDDTSEDDDADKGGRRTLTLNK